MFLKMRRFRSCSVFAAILLFFSSLWMSCEKESIVPEKHVSLRTVIVFMPWSTNMKPYFDDNIISWQKSISEGILHDEHVIVCISTSSTKGLLIELKQQGGECLRDTLCRIEYADFTKTENITRMLVDVSRDFPAMHYGLVVGGHGMAWIPSSSDAKRAPYHSGYGACPLTRWFGGLTPDSQIEISSFAEGIRMAGLHMDYILFDDCFMSSVEVAYELREVTDYLVACPSEIMIVGFPYHLCAKYLVGNVDYASLCETFIDFYQSYFVPYGTVAVTDCRVLDELASSVRNMHQNGLLTKNDTIRIQQMDGYSPHLFYDLGDTYDKLCNDSAALAYFHGLLQRAVPFKANTRYYYSANGSIYLINSYSGLTTSEFSANALAETYDSTLWYRDIHRN